MKRRLFTRFLSIALAITILSSDLSAYAASDVTETTTEVTEESVEETEKIEEIETGEGSEQEEDTVIDETEESDETEKSPEHDAEQKEIIEVQMEDVYYLVSEVETSATAIGMYSLSDGQISLKSSNETAWIDRLELTDASDIRSFYDTLVEASDNDGTADYLIDDSYLNGDYNLTVAEITEKVEVELSNAADESVVKSEVEAAVNACANEIVENYNPYIIAARDAFDRDHPEVFWLSGETAIGYSLGYQYSSPKTTDTSVSAEYTVTLLMVLKGTVNGESFDIRATGYQSQSAIEDGIADVNSACEEILNVVSELSDYEKIRYFNDILTKSNEYNTSDDLDDIGNDCRECVSALEGRTGTAGPVCEGYARAMKVLCDKEEIPCVLVSGMAKNSVDGTGEAHMWNNIQLDGKWYGVDATWNDPAGGTGAVSGYENEDWLLIGSDTVVSEMSFATSHPVENVVSTNGVAFTNGPVLSEEKYVYSEKEEETSGFTYELLEDGTASISAYVGDIPSELEIPSEIDGYTVTAIGEDAFRDCTEIASVILPESITAIGFCAFYGCTNMTTINIPENVTNIENAAFRQCKSLKEVKLPEEMENLGSFAFGECTALEQINIPEGITAMQNGVLWECDSLTSIILPESIKTIDYHAFSDCDNLKEVTIPSGVTSLDEFAFFNCISLEKIELPTTVENIGDYAFSKGDLDEKVYENLDITIYVEKKDYVYQWAVDNGFKVVLPESEDTKTGIYEIDGKFYIYRDDNLVTGYIEYEGQKYYANANGVLQTGWIKVGNVWRYFDATGDFCEISYESADGYLYILENGDISYFSNKTTLVKNTWLTISGYRYYFDENGFAVKGWYQDGSYWYYADENGRMAIGVAAIGDKKYYFDSAYHLSSGWKKIDGVFRYFNVDEDYEKCYEISMDGTTGWVNLEDGRRAYIDAASGALTGWRTIQGYRYHFNSDGFVDTGLFQDGRYYYYGETAETATNTSPIGNVVKGVRTIDGKIYGFHTSSYYRLTGWQTLDGERYYFQDDCSAVTGWYQEGNYCYYADENGRMAKGEKVIGEYTYYFDSNYRLTTGWQTINGQRYYLDANGLRVTGEFQVGNYWYYADADGIVAKGLTVVDGTTYLFHASQYYRLTGWQTVNGQRYFFNEADGKAVTGWYQEGDYWYYADANGCMAKGLTTIGGKQYYFDNSYHLSTGWKNINNQMYFFDSVAEEPEKCCAIAYDGEIGGWLVLKDGRRSYVNARYQVLTGWQTINGQRYYFDSTGFMKTGLFQDGRYYYYAEPEGELIGTLAKGVKIIDEKVYGFHTSAYYRLTGWQTFDGQRYYFQDDCSAVIGWYWDGTYWYYADANGCMVKDAQKIGEHTYYFDNNYRLTTGWVKIDNEWRYFAPAADHTECFELTYEGYDGTVNNWAMLSNGKKSYINTKSGILKGWQTIDGQRYYFDNSGIMQTGWFQVSNYWYYAEQDGSAAKGIKVIDGETYLFHTSAYYRLTGWQTMDGKRFYLDTDGKAQTGWIDYGGRKYYAELKNDGDVIKGTVVTGAKKIEESIYVFHPSQYYLLTGWQTVNGQRYYIKEDGKTVTGWYQEGDYWYYADENGCMVKDLTTIGEKQYYFDSNYRLSTGWKKIDNQMYFFDWVAEKPEKCCSISYDGELGNWFILSDDRRSYINARYQVLTGWQTINGQRYYFDSTGIMKTGLFQDGRYYYYAEPEGEAIGTMAKGAKIINGKVYGFHTSAYYRLTGWQTLNGERYYFKDDCTAMIGWYQEGNYWYYADENGCMAKGIKVINGENYYFDNNYRLTTGWNKIDNQWRFFNISDIPEECKEIKFTGYNGTASDWAVLSDNRKSYIHIRNGILKGWQTIEGKRYFFNSQGILQTGWYQDGNYWYYADENGCTANSVKNIGEHSYYFDGNYRLATGWVKINNEWRFFDNSENYAERYELDYTNDDGETGWVTLSNSKKSYIHVKNGVLKGWQTIDGQRYYFDNTGILQTGWFQVGSYWYYGAPVVKGAQAIDGKIYGFHPSQYYRLSGWQTLDGNRYYFQEDYSAVIGWHQEGDYWYYADENGRMAKDLTIIGEKQYYFDGNYRLATGWKRIGNKMYFFNDVAENPTACCAVSYDGTVGDWITLNDGRKSYINAKYQVLTGWQNINSQRYYFDSTGIMETGLFQVGRYYYYAEPKETATDECPEGSIVKGAKLIDGKIYGFHPSQYYRLTGWQTLNGERYYFQDDCAAVIGWYQEGNYWYYADANGCMVKGAQKIGEHTYYFDNNYRLTTGWIKIDNQWRYFTSADSYADSFELTYTGYDGTVNNWAIISNGKKSYIHIKNGVLKGWQTIDGQRYYFDSTGIMQTGEFQVGNYWYYADQDGVVAKGIRVIDGETYLFHTSAYYRLSGWQTMDGKRFYLGTDGKAQTGWIDYGGRRYYAEPKNDGSIIKGTVVTGAKTIDGIIYVFHPSQYYLLTGWQTVNNQRYYIKEDGSAVTGWYQEGDYWYYADTNGCMQNGLTIIGGKQYYFDANYRLSTGWKRIGNEMYFFDDVTENPAACCAISYDGSVGGWIVLKDGRKSYINAKYQVLTGWQTINSQRYYFDSTGIMETGLFQSGRYYYYAEETGENQGAIAKGVKAIDGKIYGFHASQYYRLTGWQTLNGQRYYFKDDCSAAIGWYYDGSNWYYADVNGCMLKDVHTIDGKNYYFDGNYRLTTGWVKVNNQWRFFNNAERYLDCHELTFTGYTGATNAWAILSDGCRSYIHARYGILKGWQTIDGQRYYFDSTGIMQTGEFKVGNYWYYADADGAVAKGFKEVSGKTYYFHPSQYYRLTGWQTAGGQRYYFDADGVMQTEWFEVSGYWYYADQDGKVQKGLINLTVDEQERSYYLDGNYRLQTGWITISGIKYHFAGAENPQDCYAIYSGNPAKGWFVFEGRTSYFNNSGVAVTGWQTINSKRYYFNASGVMQTGWFKVGDYWYYANSDGTTVNGLIELLVGEEKKIYYFDESYRLQTGWQTINGKKYYFVGADHPKNYDVVYVGSIKEGWQTIESGQIFYADSNGNVKTGWQTIDGQRYYFDATGALAVGWFKVGNYWYYGEEKTAEGQEQTISVGAVAKGIKVIAGDTYCFHTSGYYMLTGWQTVNGQRFYLDTDGSAKNGWFTVSGKTYYAETVTHDGIYKGTVAKGAKTIGTETYFFHSSQYYMLTGFQYDAGKRYYLQSDGTAKTGWFTVGTDLYYGEPSSTADGTLKGALASGAKQIDGETYFFHTSANYRLTGWQTVNGERYYLDADGTSRTGWFTVSGKIYYGEPSTTTDGILKGTLGKGAKEINGKTYVFHPSQYYRLTGWQTVNGERYYLDADGTARTGWFTISGKTYYAEAATTTDILKGTVAKGLKDIVTETYYFHPNQYYMLTGWQTINKERYYFDANGVMETGWFEEGGYYYYARENGIIVKGLIELAYGTAGEQKTYYFDNNYRLKTGWQTINNKKYFFENAKTPEECYATNTAIEIKTGWLELENGQISYANNRGVILTGWQTIDKQRYYFDGNGVLQTDWFKVGNYWYYGEEKAAEGQEQAIPVGAVAKGIKVIDGETYCFHTSGYYMLTGWQTVNGQRFYLESDGKAKTDWFTLSGRTYYAETSTHDGIYKGTVARGAKTVGTETYFFHSSQYYMLTGFQSYNGNRYYLQSDGTAKTGWFTVGTDLYYGEPAANGELLKGTLAKGAKEISGETYFFHTSSNYRLTGWQTVNGERYYLNENGTAKTGWFTISGKIYYGEPTTTEAGVLKGTLARGAKEINGETYVFHTSGYYRLTGWQTVYGQRYYLDVNGKAKTSWFTIGGKTYYAETAKSGDVLKGTVAKGMKTIGTETYYFHPSQYYRLTGWQTIDKQRYYFNDDGTVKKGWFTISGKTYYASPEVASGAKEIDGQTYVFHSSQYYMLTGFQSYGGKRYYLQSDGTAKTGWFTVGTDLYYGEPAVNGELLKGTLASGAKEIGGETYFFHTSSNYRLTGWQTVNGDRYYLDADGTAKTGWFTVSGKIYYGEPSTTADGILKGTLGKGAKEINGKIYIFHTSQYYRLTGWQTVGSQRYYLDTDGTAKTGWFGTGGYYYYAYSDGTLAKGLAELPYGESSEKKTYYFDTNYRLKTGWQTINGVKYLFRPADSPAECYATDTVTAAQTGWLKLKNGQISYANSRGVILTGWQTIDNQRYYFDGNGALQIDWFKVGNYWYYGEEKAAEGQEQTIPVGAVAKGIREIDGAIYCFHPSGYYMLTGWQTVNGQRFYLESDGKAKTDWFTFSGKTYYAETTTHDGIYKGTVARGAKTIGTETYFFHSSQYYMLTGFQSYNGRRYYLKSDGTARTGWFTVGTDLYYGEPAANGEILKGTLASGAKEIGGETYFFHTSSNYRLTGWQTVNGDRYYLNADGTARTGWFTVGGKIYYGEPTTTEAGVLKGTLAKGAKEINGATYVFHTSSYYRLTGWQTVGGQRYYLNTDGKAKTGWFKVGNYHYYGEPVAADGILKGTVAKGLKTIGTETYYFHPRGYYMLTGWQTINKERYYFNTNGVMEIGWFQVGSDWYYAKEDGIVVKGLVELPYGEDKELKTYYFDTNYRLKTGWYTINSKKYFFTNASAPEECYATFEGSVSYGWMTMENGQICYADSKGNVKTGWQTITGQRYYFDANGILQTGWFTVGTNTYYGEPKAAAGKEQEIPVGAVARGAKKIDGETYVFHASGYQRLTGFQSYDGKRYYLQSNGKARTGWFTVGTDLYYGEPSTTSDGVLKGTLASAAKEIGGETYFFHTSSNYRLTGWQNANGQRYYLDSDGSARTGWFIISGKNYYGEPSTTEDGTLKGTLAKGAKEIDGETYVFSTKDFYRLTGWQTVDGQRYYLESSGKAKTDWFKLAGYWYYGEPSTTETGVLKGILAKDLKVISVGAGEEMTERTYYFDSNYRLSTGWKVINKIRYFFNTDDDPKKCYLVFSGTTSNGWFTFEDGRKSYFDSKGNLLTGWQTISGKKYYFDSNGIMQTGWCTINGVDYFFNLEGIYVPITTPTFSSITSTFYRTVDVKWNLIDGVQSYTLEYSKDSIFPSWETTSIQITDTTISEYRVEALEPDTTYYFRLKYTAWGGDELNPEVVYSRYSAVKSIVVRGEVAATSTSATLSECEIVSGSRDAGMTVRLQASLKERLKSSDDKYYIVETESYGSSIDWTEPVGEIEKDFEIETEFVIDQGDGSDDVRECVDRALMNKFALAIKKDDGTYQVISTPMGITNPEAVSENTEAIFTPISKKGLQGVGFDDAADTNSKNTLFNLDLASVVGTGPADGYVAYEYKGKTYYFSECENLVWEFEQMQKGFEQYAQGKTGKNTKICVTLNLLLSYKSSNSYLIDPAARSAGHRYYTLNVREEKARETFEAVFLYLGELFGKSDCFVTHWVLGNEVNSSKAWNYQGSLSQDAYMQVYASAFRLLYNGVKAAKTGNNVYISLDNGWTAAPDTYSGKSILDKFAAYAQKENEDMLWSIAYHGYSYPLTRTDFWNDSSNTTFSISTRYISMKNISVLTNYAASLEEKYDKPEDSIRVILSEQGYTASAGQQSQAYALARGYYMAEFNDRVDAFIIRALQDDPDEIKGGLYLGLRTRYEEKRASFYTYEYMDSSIEVFGSKEATSISKGNATKVEMAQDIICNTNWESMIPGFSRSKLAGMY
ncbi:MAG: leucine-rich repeat protein [Lachnospiraceae bacterium]|nr:leucine-rich repeat protein [Lachnospiraceae bacterium]